MKVPTNPHKHKTVHTSRSSRFSLWAGVSCDAMRRSTSKKRGGRKASILKADSEAELISDLNMAGFTFATAPGGRAPGAAPAPAAARVSKPDKRRSSVMALASNALSFIGAPAMAKAKVTKNFRWAPTRSSRRQRRRRYSRRARMKSAHRSTTMTMIAMKTARTTLTMEAALQRTAKACAMALASASQSACQGVRRPLQRPAYLTTSLSRSLRTHASEDPQGERDARTSGKTCRAVYLLTSGSGVYTVDSDGTENLISPSGGRDCW